MAEKDKRRNTKFAAWGEMIVLLAIGGIFTYLKPAIGIPLLVALFCFGCLLIWRAHSNQSITVAVLFVLISVVILSIWQAYSIYSRIDTKQDIRTLLESIKPEILRRIDVGQKDIHILMNIPTEVKLKDLSQRPDFNKFLRFEQNHDVNNPFVKDYINDENDFSWKADYRIYPKDALIK